MTYSQTLIANFSAPSRVVSISYATDYVPGEDFVIFVSAITSGTAVVVRPSGSDADVTIKAVEGQRLGGQVGIVCSAVRNSGTSAGITLFAMR